MLRSFLTKLKENTVPLNYGRDILANWAKASGSKKILDLGMGHGTDLLMAKQALLDVHQDVSLYGLDTYQPSLEQAQGQNIEAKFCNIEKDLIPFEAQFFDLVIANQVIEHTKELFWIFSEISRVLRPGGYVLIGVPNLASFHNRMALLFGIQPTSIEVLGPHVRGFTAGSLKTFLETDGYFEVEEVKGSNFYPFPKLIAQILSKLFPKASVSIFLKVRRTDKDGKFSDILKTRFFETPYYIGPSLNT